MVAGSMEACDMAGVSVAENGEIRTLAASTDLLRKIDHWQFELRRGPCYDALLEHEVITANDLANDERWPEFGSRIAAETGLHSSMSFRLFTSGHSLGALNRQAR